MSKKWVLYITGFFSGMSVMAIELGASRLLAPYFSSSQIVWTIVIATIMIAMALGNIVGGKLADKHETPTHLFFYLFLAAIWTALIPLVGKFIIAGVALLLALFVTSGYLIWAAFISCILVFVFPLLILGMVTPSLIKYAVKDMKESGKTVGTIEALGTIGSIIGTFIPTFISIPFVGTALTFVIFASVLFLITLVYFIFWIKTDPQAKNIVKMSICGFVGVVTIILGGLSNLIGIAFWDKSILYEGESIYNYLRVEETSDSYILSTNVLFGVQSIKMKEKGLTGMYYDYALASPVLANANKEDVDMLILGLGTGTFATQSFNYFNNVNVTGVEIDQKIVDLAYKYFDLSKEVNVHVTDGRAFLTHDKNKYDVIMVDAYQDITIPFQMSSIEFFKEVKKHLTDKGNMVVNMNMYTNNKGGINDYLSGTIREVFDSVYVTKTSGTNMELFASSNYDIKEQLKINNIDTNDYQLKSLINNIVFNMEEIQPSNYILTDDKAKVELLGMGALDKMVNEELKGFKNEIKGKSFKELIEILMSGELF